MRACVRRCTRAPLGGADDPALTAGPTSQSVLPGNLATQSASGLSRLRVGPHVGSFFLPRPFRIHRVGP
jgi:hypothetical protein